MVSIGWVENTAADAVTGEMAHTGVGSTPHHVCSNKQDRPSEQTSKGSCGKTVDWS